MSIPPKNHRTKKEVPRDAVHERELSRESKKSELRKEYDVRELLVEQSRTSPRDDFDEAIGPMADRLRDLRLSGIRSKEGYVTRGLDAWEHQQSAVVAGLYRDEEKVLAAYQQRFFECSRQLKPEIVEELREFVPLFEQVFHGEKDRFDMVFDRDLSDLGDSNLDLETYLRTQIFNLRREQGINQPWPDLRLYREKDFDEEFLWGEYTLLFQFVRLASLSQAPSEKSDAIDGALVCLQKHLVFSSDTQNLQPQANKQEKERTIESVSRAVVDRILRENDIPLYAEGAIQAIANLLGDLNHETSSQTFIELQLGLLKWAERHNFTTDWLLAYAYVFLSEMSKKPTVPTSEIESPLHRRRTLRTDIFRFQFDPWLPGDESKESYEVRLIEAFEIARNRFFQRCGKDLNLDLASPESVKRVTKPIDPDLEKVKWLLAWNEGFSYDQITKIFNKSTSTIRGGISHLEILGLPKRRGKPGGTLVQHLSEERLRVIKSLT